MNGLDFVVLSILSTTVIVIIGFAVKACVPSFKEKAFSKLYRPLKL